MRSSQSARSCDECGCMSAVLHTPIRQSGRNCTAVRIAPPQLALAHGRHWMTDQPVDLMAHSSSSDPDLKWVNRHLPIRDICSALGLGFGAGGMIHCWHPERHKAGDRRSEEHTSELQSLTNLV